MLNVVKAPKGADVSDVYKVFIRQAGEEWQQASVYLALTPITQLTFDKTYFVNFDYSGEVEIRVEYSKPVNSFSLKPLSYNIHFESFGNTLTFILNSDSGYNFITVQPDDDLFGSLHIFANKPSKFNNAYTNVMYFKKGIYNIDNCDYITLDKHGNPIVECIEDNSYIYLEDGAIVHASFIMRGVKNVKIEGHGIISQLELCEDYENGFNSQEKSAKFKENSQPAIHIRSGSSDISINGITIVPQFRDIVVRNSDKIKVEGVKMLSHAQNADGFNAVNASDITVKDCFIHTNDDCVCMYTSYDSIPFLTDEDYEPHAPFSQRYEISGCVLWTVCRPFVFGGHARGVKGLRDIVSDIHVTDIEITDVPYCLHSESSVKYWSGYFRILSQSDALVKNIIFENVNAHLTDGYKNQPIHIEVRNDDDASYSERGGYRIENIAFKNINFYNSTQENTVPCFFKAPNGDSDYAVDGIFLENVTLNGKNLSELNDTWYEEMGNVKRIITA